MEQIELLEAELILMQDNIRRLKDYVLDEKNRGWKPCQSNVVGELKHRSVALKQRLTEIQKINTSNLFR
jgi:hypothetical protein